MPRSRVMLISVVCLFAWHATAQDSQDLAARAGQSLRRAVTFFREQVAVQGGYLWRYSADLTRREGEGKASATMAWVQPPGTPSVGTAFLELYTRTGDRFYLEAAIETAEALVKGQLQSGGWEYYIEFEPERRKTYAYRSDARHEGRNTTVLDDDTTQAALRFLMNVDHTLEFRNTDIHEAVLYALDALLKAQYPNGAWPQRYKAFPEPEKYPIKPARYPDTWSRTHEKKDYTSYYTLNDNTLGDMIKTMFLAAEVYADAQYRTSAIRGGEFILLAQMPEPQPAWAQQYDAEMHPAWARKFEPPAVTGGESQDVMRTLLDLHAQTGNARYLDSVGRALEYLKRSLLPDGRLARFYELRTNTPLYFTKTYELTYSDADTPTHYSFVVPSRLDAIEAEYRTAKEGATRISDTRKPGRPVSSPPSAAEVKAVIDAMDSRGAWVEKGRLDYHGDDDPTREVIDCQTFIRNVRFLGDFIAAQSR